MKGPVEIAADYQARIVALRDEWLAGLWWPSCEEAPRGARGCGLLSERLTGEWINRFIQQACEQDPQEDLTEECRAAMTRNITGAFMRRYVRANERDVQVACSREPERCERFDRMEILYLTSHNAAVAAQAERRIADLVTEHARAQAVARQERQRRAREAEDQQRAISALGAGFAAAGQSLQSSASTSPAINSPSGSQSTARTCSSDLVCGYGYTCAKPAGSYTGECAILVNRYGVQQFSAPRNDSLGPGRRQCTYDSQCGIGFRCDQGRCLK